MTQLAVINRLLSRDRIIEWRKLCELTEPVQDDSGNIYRALPYSRVFAHSVFFQFLNLKKFVSVMKSKQMTILRTSINIIFESCRNIGETSNEVMELKRNYVEK